MARKVLLGSYLFYLQQTTLIRLLVRKGAAPDLRRGLTGADPGVDDEADSEGREGSEGWTEKSDSSSVSLISLRTLLARLNGFWAECW